MPTETVDEAADLRTALAAEVAYRELIQESYADLERLYRDDIGWQKIGQEAEQFTAEGRKKIAALADLAVTGNALVKKGFSLRAAYIWGAGVTTRIDDDGDDGTQDVNAVWSDFCDLNKRVFTSSEARVATERRLATAGEVFWAFPTEARTGRVRVRRIPPEQITDRYTDPEDTETVWFYKREWTAVTVDRATGTRGSQPRIELYPALGFWPATRPRTYQGHPVVWGTPVRHVAVNVPDEAWRGLGDVVAALPWARVDKEFLEDLAVYTRALTRILGQVSGPTTRAAARAQSALAAAETQPGAFVATDPTTTVSMVSKAGAQIDPDTHRPFATMVAAALEVPLTMLLGDPGITGARATAETLDQPTELTFGLRRELHTEVLRDVAGYVIGQAVLAPAGPLRGVVARDGDQLVVSLPEGDSQTLVVTWPDFDTLPLKDLVAAIVAAAGTEKLPPLVIVKLLAAAFELDDVDELVASVTDEDGNWVDPHATAAAAAVEAWRAGRDPLTGLTGP